MFNRNGGWEFCDDRTTCFFFRVFATMWRLHPAAVAVKVACALWVCGNTLAKRTLKRRPSWTQLKSSLTITWGRPFFQNTLRYYSVGYTPDDILENILVMVRFICIFWTRPHHIVGNSIYIYIIYPSKYLHLYPLFLIPANIRWFLKYQIVILIYQKIFPSQLVGIKQPP